jgi:hypothetical protein
MQREELEAIRASTRELNRPIHLAASLAANDRTIKSLIDRKLISWMPSRRGSGFGKMFRAVVLTDAGHAALGSVV